MKEKKQDQTYKYVTGVLLISCLFLFNLFFWLGNDDSNNINESNLNDLNLNENIILTSDLGNITLEEFNELFSYENSNRLKYFRKSEYLKNDISNWLLLKKTTNITQEELLEVFHNRYSNETKQKEFELELESRNISIDKYVQRYIMNIAEKRFMSDENNLYSDEEILKKHHLTTEDFNNAVGTLDTKKLNLFLEGESYFPNHLKFLKELEEEKEKYNFKTIDSFKEINTIDIDGLGINFVLDNELCYDKQDRLIVKIYGYESCIVCDQIYKSMKSNLKPYLDENKVVLEIYDVRSGDDLMTDEVEEDLSSSEWNFLREHYASAYYPNIIIGCKYSLVGHQSYFYTNPEESESKRQKTFIDLALNKY